MIQSLCNQHALQWVDEIRYLGLQFASQLGMHATYSSLHSKMWAAWALLQKQFRQLKCAASIGLLFRLYKTCVPPTALYGAGVWGPYRLPPPLGQCCATLMRSHLQMLRQIAGVRSTISTDILLREFDVRSLDCEWWLCAVRFWNGLVALPAEHLYKRIALDACRAAITLNVKNWAWAMFRGIRGMGYDMVISATDMIYVDVRRIRQLFDAKVAAVWTDLDYCPRLGHAHPTRLVCVHIKLGVLGLLHVVGSLMFNCHCLLHVSDRYSSLDWVVMVCLATLAHGQVSLVLTGCADFAGLAPWVMRSILFLSVPIYNPFGTNIQDCLGFQPWCSSSGRMIM